MTLQPAPPESLQAQASAALAFFNTTQSSEFKITGFVPGPLPATPTDEADLQLILCGVQDGQDVCLKERFRVGPAPQFNVNHIAQANQGIGSPAAELDPPKGTRDGWLEKVIADSEFVVLLFYRGLW